MSCLFFNKQKKLQNKIRAKTFLGENIGLDVKVLVPDVKVLFPDVKVLVPDVKVQVPDVKVLVPDVKVLVPDVKVMVPACGSTGAWM